MDVLAPRPTLVVPPIFFIIFASSGQYSEIIRIRDYKYILCLISNPDGEIKEKFRIRTNNSNALECSIYCSRKVPIFKYSKNRENWSTSEGKRCSRTMKWGSILPTS